jgi:hypothetical protein
MGVKLSNNMVASDFQGMKILVVQKFSYKEGAIVIVDFEP